MKFTNNKRFFLNIFAVSLGIFGITILPSATLALYFGEKTVYKELFIVAFICILCGTLINRLVKRNVEPVKPRAWYITVLFTWLFFICVTSVTIFLGYGNISVIDSIYEATASLTGTGSSTIDVSMLSPSLKLWRATLNWVGSVGIIMTTLSILPTWQFLGRGIALTEIPGPTFLKTNTIFYKGYRKLIPIFLGVTLAHFVLLACAGMPAMDAVLTALSGTSNSGLLHFKNGDISGMSNEVKVIITIFALIGSIDANIFFLAARKKFRAITKRSEVKFYFWRVVVTATVMTIAICIAKPEMNVAKAIGDTLLQTISYASTSGFTVTDTSNWPELCRIVILLTMFMGACAVSTGGGIKMSRVIIMVKTVSFSIFRHIHPRSVRSLMMNKEPLKSDQIVRANVYVSLFMTTFLIGTLLLTWDNMPLLDALSYSQALLTNTGSSISKLTTSVADFSILAKSVSCLLMLAGRMEIYPLLMLFMPSFWHSDNTH